MFIWMVTQSNFHSFLTVEFEVLLQVLSKAQIKWMKTGGLAIRSVMVHTNVRFLFYSFWIDLFNLPHILTKKKRKKKRKTIHGHGNENKKNSLNRSPLKRSILLVRAHCTAACVYMLSLPINSMYNEQCRHRVTMKMKMDLLYRVYTVDVCARFFALSLVLSFSLLLVHLLILVLLQFYLLF